MKRHNGRTNGAFFSILAAVLGILAPVGGQADNLYWDANGAGSGTGGSGDWNLTALAWRNGNASGTLQSWADNNSAYFAGNNGTHTLTLTEDITADKVYLESPTTSMDVVLKGSSDLHLVTGGTDDLRSNSKNKLRVETDVVLEGANAFVFQDYGNGVEVTGNITGSANINLAGGSGANWLLSGNNSGYSGMISIGGIAPILEIGHDNALGTVQLSINDAQTLRAVNGARTIGVKLDHWVSTVETISFEGDLTFTGLLNVGGSSGTWVANVVNASDRVTFSGSVSAAQPLRKTGAGTLVFASNTSAFGAGVEINAGLLYINGTASSQGNYTVGTSATLGGTGTISLATGKTNTVLAGGTIAPGGIASGTEVGTLTFSSGTFDFREDAVYAWQYKDGVGDKVQVNGTLILPSVATVNVSQVSGALPGVATLFSATAPLAGATDLKDWVVTGLPNWKAKIQNQDVILSPPSGGTVIIIR